MPYFKWYATDASGKLHTGSSFVRSADLVKKAIRAQGLVELISCHAQAPQRFSLSVAERAQFFEQLATLLHARVRVADALAIAEKTVTQGYVRLVVADCTAAVREGVPLSKVCEYHADVFTPFACSLLLAGEESGALAAACKSLAVHYYEIDTVAKKVKSTLLLPLVTLSFFFVVLAIIFIAVIPRFATLLYSLRKPLPRRTELLIGLSEWVNHLHPLVAIAGLVGLFFVLRLLFRKISKQPWFGKWCLWLPYVGNWLYSMAAIAFFRTLGSLLVGGVDITKALQVAVMSVSFEPLRNAYATIAAEVQAGRPLSEAFERSPLEVAPVCKAMIAVGEASGNLGLMLVRCADFYQAQLYKMLALINQLIQPVMLILLGLLVAMLVFALYEPLLTLSASFD